ncbi:MAG: hypothetical protein KF916_02420 [Microbacteriaceae bacterium]|nr:hypothetical protein [Microbacteriaceae bacterium]
MGVPITFTDKHNPDQFEVAAYTRNQHCPEEWKLPSQNGYSQPFISGKAIYDRLLIRRKL